jgi:hypothetical protein
MKAAVEQHRADLKQLETREIEERDRRGYTARLPHSLEASDWESEAVWPEE